jgi:hypothetical protein
MRRTISIWGQFLCTVLGLTVYRLIAILGRLVRDGHCGIGSVQCGNTIVCLVIGVAVGSLQQDCAHCVQPDMYT